MLIGIPCSLAGSSGNYAVNGGGVDRVLNGSLPDAHDVARQDHYGHTGLRAAITMPPTPQVG